MFGISALITALSEGQTNTQAIISFATTGFIGALLSTAAVVSFIRYTHKPSADEQVSNSVTGLSLIVGIIAMGVVLLIGKSTQTDQSINWLVLPLITIPAVTIPIWLILRLGTKDLPSESRWRAWSTFGLSISITPLLLLILEIVVLVFVFFMVVIYVVANPALAGELETLSNQFTYPNISQDDAVRYMVPYLTKPGVLISAFALFSIIFPMLEEAFKPLGVWLLAGKLTSQAQGFALGALCGAGFALVETLNVSAQTENWTSVLIARIGTAAMHITASALVGSGILSAVNEKRYLRLFSTYFFAVLLHGLWNFAALSNSFSTVLNIYEPSDLYQTIATCSGIGLAVLAAALIVILIILNRRQPKTATVDVQNVVVESPPENRYLNTDNQTK